MPPTTARTHDVDLIDPKLLGRIDYRVRRIAKIFRLTADDRRDLRQQFLLEILEALEGLQPDERGYGPLITTILNRRYCSHLRRLSSRHRRCVTDPVKLEDVEADMEYSLPDERSGSATDRLLTAMTVDECVDRLPPRLRRIAEALKYHDPTQAAEILGVHNSTVYRAIRDIRARFEAAGVRESSPADADDSDPTGKHK